jgi:hypothetical protein
MRCLGKPQFCPARAKTKTKEQFPNAIQTIPAVLIKAIVSTKFEGDNNELN